MPVTPLPYELTILEHPSYLHATVTGERTPENAARYLQEVHQACVRSGKWAVLLEMNFSGPSLDMASIFRVISRQSRDGSALRRIAYVDAAAANPGAPRFAETVAANRGVNVRMFADVGQAARWLSSPP